MIETDTLDDLRLEDQAAIAIDPRTCMLCGFTIDRHDMVDDGDGPLFFCAEIDPENLTLPELECRAELLRQEEVAVILARLEAADDPSKRPPLVPRAEPYRTPQSTEAAFKYVCSLNDADYLARWLANHPADAPELFKIWKGK
jgi:hypothetical protein